jgi:hypothetical protein
LAVPDLLLPILEQQTRDSAGAQREEVQAELAAVPESERRQAVRPGTKRATDYER